MKYVIISAHTYVWKLISRFTVILLLSSFFLCPLFLTLLCWGYATDNMHCSYHSIYLLFSYFFVSYILILILRMIGANIFCNNLYKFYFIYFNILLHGMTLGQKSWKVVSKYEQYLHKMSRTMYNHAQIAHISHLIYKAHLLGVTKLFCKVIRKSKK